MAMPRTFYHQLIRHNSEFIEHHQYRSNNNSVQSILNDSENKVEEYAYHIGKITLITYYRYSHHHARLYQSMEL